jgi:LacI family transcriptional regulator
MGVKVNFADDYARDIHRGVVSWCLNGNRWQPFAIKNSLLQIPLSQFSCEGYVGQTSENTLLSTFLSAGRPTVNVSGCLNDMPFHTVKTDDIAVGVMAAEYFHDLGFRNFRYIQGWDCEYSRLRYQGFRKRLEAMGHKSILSVSLDEVVEKVLECRTEDQSPTALFCNNDEAAAHLLKILLERNIRVPEAYSVLGVDNDSLLGINSKVSLSSIELAGEKVGYEAAALLDRLYSNPKLPRKDILIPPLKVHTRQSTDILAVDDEYVRKALHILQREYQHSVHLGQLVQKVGLSRRMLEIRFKKAMGRTMYEELIRLRLERAKELLVTTDLPILRIAEQVGWPESRHLSNTFKKQYQTTPREWRKRYSTL